VAVSFFSKVRVHGGVDPRPCVLCAEPRVARRL
jgi:hypothetical protein